jgi:RNA polymerase sigma-70 factor (family 1)
MTGYKGHADTELLHLLNDGDHKAYKEIYDRYWASLYRHSLRMLQDTDQAKDVVQDVFTMLWAKRDEFDFHTSLSSFLYAAVRNRTLNQIDHSKVRSDYIISLQHAIEEGAYSTDELLNEKELAKRIEAELANLPEKMRVVFELSRKHDYSYREIADKLCITDHTVKKQMSNALKILRTRIGMLFTFF